jgi:NADH-quinone oxidoreductase subunit N
METLLAFFSNEIVLLWILLIIFFVYLIEKIIYEKTFDRTFLILVFILLFLILCNIWFINISMPCNLYLLNNYFIYSNTTQNIKGFIICLSLFYIIYLYNFSKIVKIPIFEYTILIIIIIFSLFLMVSANNLFYIFLFLEMVNLSLYVLIGLNKYSNFGIEIAYKYFLQSSYATLIGLFGVSIIYIKTGTLFLSELGFIITSYSIDNLLIFSFLLIFITFFFKLGLFPLHNWVADLYQNAHLATVTFIGTIPKIVYIYIFFEIYSIIHQSHFIFFFIIFIGFLSVIYGSILSLYEVSFRRLLGYGSIVHMGFITIAIGLFELLSVASAFLYIIFYTLLMFTAFVFLLIFIRKKEESNEIIFIDNITAIGVFFNKSTLLSIIFSFTMLSLAGLPFFMGFFSKLYILLALISSGYFFLVVILLFMNILITLYYIRLIRFLLFNEDKDIKNRYLNLTIKYSKGLYGLMMTLFILNIFILFYHNYILLFILNNIIIFFY